MESDIFRILHGLPLLQKNKNDNNKKNIYIIGGGWGCASFIKHIDTDKYNVHVISKEDNFLYTSLLAQNITKNVNLEQNLKNINNKIIFERNEVIDVDFNSNTIITLQPDTEDKVNQVQKELVTHGIDSKCDRSHSIPLKPNKIIKYDYIIFSHGSEINTFNISGVQKYCQFLKNNNSANNIKNKLKDLPENSNIAVIGLGLTGSEIIGHLIDSNQKKFNIYAIDGLNRPLTLFTPSISSYVTNIWQKNNIHVKVNTFVKSIDKNNICISQNNNALETINYDLAIWAGGVKISGLSQIINKKLNSDCKFGINVDKYLAIPNTKNSYAIGDCSYNKPHNSIIANPPTAQVAYQQGKYLAKKFNNPSNIEPYKFDNKGQICYIGGFNSVYQNNYFTSSGRITYYLNKIIHVYNAINYKQMINIIKGDSRK